MMTSPRAVDRLAAFLTETAFETIPTTVIARAADCVLDVFGAAAAGRASEATRTYENVMARTMSDGSSKIWFSGKKSSEIGAATVNAMAATALDIDDGHRKAAGHPGVAVVVAAVATAEAIESTVQAFLASVVLGYEASVRVALARRPEHHQDTTSGRWSGIGAAVAAAQLTGADATTMAQTILIAEQHAPQLSSAALHGFAGSDVKEGIAWSVISGMHAAELASAGFRGYPDTFEQNILYDPGVLISDLEGFQAIDGLFFKPYACCRWIHSAIDAVMDILESHNLRPADIDEIEVRTFRRAVELANDPTPGSAVDAQFSVPFCIGLAACRGKAAFLPMEFRRLGDPDVLEISHKTRVVFDEEMESMFPAKTPAIVHLTRGSQVFSRRVESAFGDPANPMSRYDLQAKFRTLAGPVLGEVRTEALIACMNRADAVATTSVRDEVSPLY